MNIDKLLPVSLIIGIALILSGCAPGRTTLNSDTSAWSHLDNATKIQLVQSEFEKLDYTGVVSATTVVKDMDTDTDRNQAPSLDLKANIDIELGGAIGSKEEQTLTNEDSDSSKLNQLKSFMNSSDGRMLVKLKETNYTNEFSSKISALTAKVNAEAEAAKQRQANLAKQPLKVEKAYVKLDVIGTPEAYVVVKNVSNKSVIAYKIDIRCYNSFGEPVDDIVSGNNIFKAIAQGHTIYPGHTFGSDYSWMLAVQDTTTNIKAQITEVEFSNGTSWSISG